MQRPRILLRLSFFVVLCFFISLVSNRTTAANNSFQFRYEIMRVANLSGNTALAQVSQEYLAPLHALLLTDYGWIDQGALIPSRPLATDEYRYTSALDGDTAAIATKGSCGEYGTATNSAIFIFKRSGTTWSQQQEITLPCSSGFELALDGNTLLFINKTFFTDGDSYGYYTDSATFYAFNGTSWNSVSTVDLDTDNCTCILEYIHPAVSGDTAIMVGGSSTGLEAKVFKRSGGTWSQQTTLPYTDDFPDLDVDGNTAIVGASVYVTNGTNWTLQTTFDFEPVNPDHPGYAVSLDGNQLSYSGTGQPTNGIMVRSGTTWSAEPIGLAPNLSLSFSFTVLSGNRVLFGLTLMSRGPVPNELPYAEDYFLDGNTVLFHDVVQGWNGVPNPEEGTVYARNLTTGIWEKQAGIQENGIEDVQFAGAAAALQGDTAVLTSYGQDDRSSEPRPAIDGTVTIYQRSGNQWNLQQTLTFNPNFGGSTDLDGNTILVSDPGEYDSYNREIIFIEKNGNTWVPTETFIADNGPGGVTVGLSGDLALVTVENGAQVYLRTYQRVNGTWVDLPQANINDSSAYGLFDLDGNTAVVANRVYVFNGTNWVLQATLMPSEPVSERLYSAIEGNTVILASEFKSFVFTRSGTTWTQQQKLMIGGLDIGYKPQGVPDDVFGYPVNVDLSNNIALVRRYTFDISSAPVDPTPTPVVTEDPTSGPTEEPTPTSTPSSPDAPLNENPSFETNGLTGWTLKDATGDKLKCSTDKPVAHTGNCAFQFKNADKSGKLQQTVDFTGRVEKTGSHLELSLFARVKGNAKGEARVIVIYSDDSKQKFGVDITDAGNGYMEFSQTAALTQSNLSKAKIVIKGTNSRGKFLVDDITLKYVEAMSGFSVLPLP